MIDHWEVDWDLVTLEEELGEGAFGKVYKGIIKELTTPSQKMIMTSRKSRKNTCKQTGGFTVALKMLHGELYCLRNLKMWLRIMNKKQLMTLAHHQLLRNKHSDFLVRE